MSWSESLLRRLGPPLAAAALLALHASASLEARLTRSSMGSARSAADEVVLLSRVEVTRLLALGRDMAAADALWVRAIQYFARHMLTDRRFPLLEPLVEQVLALDPRFRDAYFWAGTSVLYAGQVTPERVHRANAFYLAAMERFPEDYEAPYRLGINLYSELRAEDPAQRARDQRRGLAYLERAARARNAPESVRDLVRGVARRLGDDEVLFYALTDELARASSAELRATLEGRLEELMARMARSGELRALLAGAERLERERLASAPYLDALDFEQLAPRPLSPRSWRELLAWGEGGGEAEAREGAGEGAREGAGEGAREGAGEGAGEGAVEAGGAGE